MQNSQARLQNFGGRGR